MKSRLVLFFTLLSTTFLLVSEGYTSEMIAPDDTWEDWANRSGATLEAPVVQNRQVTKSGHFQILGPTVGLSERGDLFTTINASIAGRYFFSEHHGWEFLRLSYSHSTPNHLNSEVKNKTSFYPDVQLSQLQLGTHYIFSPVYGKYSWGADKIVYFDIYGTVGGGARFAEDSKKATQPFGELGIGMNHYLFSNHLAIVPEYRVRMYPEQRTASTFVAESQFQIGVSWIFY